MKLLKCSSFQLCSGVFILFLVAIPSLSATEAQIVTLGEAVDNTKLNWSTGGSASWFGQTSMYYYDGDAAQSDPPSNGQVSWIETTIKGPGFLTFYWKNWSGNLDFSVDGVERAKSFSSTWTLKGLSIPAGEHTLHWNFSTLLSDGAGYLDKVTFGPEPAIVVDVPNGGEILSQREFYTIRWVNSADVTEVKIGLYKGTNLFRSIIASTPGDGSYNWFVPLSIEPATDYRVRVASPSNPTIYDDSDAGFSVAPTLQPTLKGALVLDGADDYAEAADHSELDLAGGSFTIEAWVNFQNLGGVFIKPGAYGLHVEKDPSRNHCMWIDYPCQVGHCTSSKYLSLGWHHIALVYDAAAGQARAYYDGTQRCSATCSASNSDQPLWVGKGSAGSLEGAVDEMRISSVARYVGAFTPPTEPFSCDDSTRALWHFEEFEGATVFHDACGAADNTLVGSNGAHTEGVPARQVYLPVVLRRS